MTLPDASHRPEHRHEASDVGVVIIAGGLGSRLWPLSTMRLPKYLFPLFADGSSLLERTYRRATRFSDSVYLGVGSSQAPHVKAKLPQVPVDAYLIEPSKRGTGNAILATILALTQREVLDKPVVWMPADLDISDELTFIEDVIAAVYLSSSTNGLVLLGAPPLYPSSELGYIKKGVRRADQPRAHIVEAFREKPEPEEAAAIMTSGDWLWNTGCYVASLRIMRAAIMRHSPALRQNLLFLEQSNGSGAFMRRYRTLASVGLENELLTSIAGEATVYESRFAWRDLGTYEGLRQVVPPSHPGQNRVRGEAIVMQNVTNSFVINTTDSPLVIAGLDRVLVVHSPQGTLVCHEDAIGSISLPGESE